MIERSIAPESPQSDAAAASEESRPATSGDIMGGFAKGLAVIEAYGRKRQSLTIAEVARLSGLDRASARRCLLTLVKGGYAKTDGRYFELTPRILRLGHSYLAASLPRLVQPTLDRLADALRESCSASVLDGTEIVYIARAAQHRMIGVGLHRGSRLPAYCTSMGRVLLAAAPPEQARALLLESDRKAITARTITDLDALIAELERIRHDGYSVIDQEVEIGSISISVPIRNIVGQTVAAFVVALHATPANSERLRTEILAGLLDAQKELAEILP
jgi:IclR family transcriptional regulator, pca regulon regulatory protein